MQYGFVIDHDNCIGCHACTVACKSENDVPVGNFRTSVKYVEEGAYPEIKRHFLVQRCNHCSDAPWLRTSDNPPRSGVSSLMWLCSF